MIIPFFILSPSFYLIWKIYIKKEYPQFYENNIIFRNAYHSLKDIYLNGGKIPLSENLDEENQRKNLNL